MVKPQVALQLFSVRDELARDFAGTLRAVAGIGYRAVELVSYGGTHGLSGAELRRTLADVGLTTMGVHIGADALRERFDETVGHYVEAGVPEVIVPSLPHDDYAGPDGCRRGGEWLGQLARRCRALGVGLSYHNHHLDFTRFDNDYGLDLILAAAAPETIGLEVDVYWITYAGFDPTAMIGRYADRCQFVHLKDRPAVVDVRVEDVMAGKADGSRMFAEVGEGVIDWPAVFAAVEATPAAWYVVEQDASARPMLESVALSFHHLRAWGKV